MKTKIRTVLQNTLTYCTHHGHLKDRQPPEYVVEIPNNPQHGHFATNLPLTLAAAQKRPPREIATMLLTHLQDAEDLFAEATIAGPGFINFSIRPHHWTRLLEELARAGTDLGRSRLGQGRRIMIEFVSANPTGPLHLGHGRGAALGDTLCRILAFCGYDVLREFYINDAGQQMRLLGESIYARWRQQTDPAHPFPENGYHGGYVLDLADRISGSVDLAAYTPEQAMAECMQRARDIMLAEIQADLARFRVDFDHWFSENQLFRNGALEQTVQELRDRNQLYEKDGALWVRTREHGDDKDRVLQKRDGHFTYFASDIAYHLDKHRRGVEKAVNIWGADHHGYIPRMRAALEADGLPKDWLAVILIQLVKLWRHGEEVRMSKRAGNFVTLAEFLDDVGPDAARFVFLTKSPDSPLDVDVDLMKKQDSDNPVYYVQYAHARLCSVLRKGAAEGFATSGAGALGELRLEEEIALVRAIAEFPPLLEDISVALEPHRLTYYLGDLAALFHRYFNVGSRFPEHRIVSADADLSRVRLLLADVLRQTLASGLQLLGVSAPDRM